MLGLSPVRGFWSQVEGADYCRAHGAQPRHRAVWGHGHSPGSCLEEVLRNP